MAKYYCKKYFYPEKYDRYKCEQNELQVCPRECCFSSWCSHKLYLNNEELAVMDSLRVVKAQNLEILKQNKQIIEELALQQLQKYK